MVFQEVLSQTYNILDDVLTALSLGINDTVNLTYDVTGCGQRLSIATHLEYELEVST